MSFIVQLINHPLNYLMKLSSGLRIAIFLRGRLLNLYLYISRDEILLFPSFSLSLYLYLSLSPETSAFSIHVLMMGEMRRISCYRNRMQTHGNWNANRKREHHLGRLYWRISILLCGTFGSRKVTRECRVSSVRETLPVLRVWRADQASSTVKTWKLAEFVRG